MWNFKIKELPAYNKSGSLEEVMGWAKYMVPSIFEEIEPASIQSKGSFESKADGRTVSIWESDRPILAPVPSLEVGEVRKPGQKRKVETEE